MQSHAWSGPGRRAFGGLGAARILVASDAVAARLTLQTLLEKSGYLVDTAVSPTAAMEKIESCAYDMVLCASCNEDHDACRRLFAVAEAQDHRPATATLTISSELSESHGDELFIEPVDVPLLLTQITDRLAERAYGRSQASAARRARLSGGAAA